MPRTLKVILFIAFVWTAAHLSAETQPDGVESDGKIPIQIRVVSQLHSGSQYRSSAYLSVMDEFYHFKEALEECLEEIEGPYRFEIERFPKKVDEDAFGITLYLHEWRANRGGFIRAYFSAHYRWQGEKNKIGQYAGDAFQTISSMRMLIEKSYKEAVLDAGERFVEDLQLILDRNFAGGKIGEEK